LGKFDFFCFRRTLKQEAKQQKNTLKATAKRFLIDFSVHLLSE
jgi:hypothetical protein